MPTIIMSLNKNFKPKKMPVIGIVIWGGVILPVIIFALKCLHYPDLFPRVIEWIGNLGILGPIFFIIVYILATLLFLPGLLLTLGAGFLFGVVWGSVYVCLGSNLGAMAAFLVGRYFARNWVEKQIFNNDKFKAIDGAVAAEGWKFVGLCRLSPLFPFNLLNYAFGVTKVSLSDYFWASLVGMLPATVMYVYLGSLVKDFTLIGLQKQPTTTIEWILRFVGFFATVGVTIYGTVIAKRSLSAIEKKET